MKCDEFDERVHGLLDDRASIHGDQRLPKHAAHAVGCSALTMISLEDLSPAEVRRSAPTSLSAWWRRSAPSNPERCSQLDTRDGGMR